MSKEEKENTSITEVKENEGVSEWSITKEMAKSYMMSMFKPKNMTIEDAMMVMEAGREMKIGRLYSMRSLYPVNGNIGMRANFMLARFNTMYPNGDLVWLEQSEKAARLKIRKRKDQEFSQFEYTVEEAKKTPEYSRNPNYQSRIVSMLLARCVSRTMNNYAPEVNMGLYTPEELEFFDINQVESQPKPEPPRKRTIEVDATKPEPVKSELPKGEFDDPVFQRPKTETPKSNGNGKIKVWESFDENKNKILAAKVFVERVTDKGGFMLKGLGWFNKSHLTTKLNKEDEGKEVGIGFTQNGIDKLKKECADKIEFDENVSLPDEDEIIEIKEWTEVIPKEKQSAFIVDYEEEYNNGNDISRDEFAVTWIKEHK